MGKMNDLIERYSRYGDCEEYHVHDGADGAGDGTEGYPRNEHKDFDEEELSKSIKDLLIKQLGVFEPILENEPGRNNDIIVRNAFRSELREKIERL